MPKKILTVEDAARYFKDHEGVTTESIETWLRQFDDGQGDLAFKILQNITYHSKASLRCMAGDFLRRVKQHLKVANLNDVLFVPIGDPCDASAFVARVLKDNPNIRKEHIKHQSDLANVPEKPKYKAIVLFDNFSGSGQQISDWWKLTEALLLPWSHKSVKLILFIFVVNYKALESLKEIPIDRLSICNLGKHHNVLASESSIFSSKEKTALKAYCRRTACAPEYIFGKGECGLLLSFAYGCPNNSLPILWHQSGKWKRLFKRHGL